MVGPGSGARRALDHQMVSKPAAIWPLPETSVPAAGGVDIELTGEWPVADQAPICDSSAVSRRSGRAIRSLSDMIVTSAGQGMARVGSS